MECLVGKKSDLFFRKITEMAKCEDGDAQCLLSSLMDDEHGGNKIGMADVFGEDVVNKSAQPLVNITDTTVQIVIKSFT